MALLLSAGMAVTTCPVPGAQEPPAEQIHTEQAEESSAAVHSDDSDREGTAADEFQSETEPSGSETETGAYEEETSENENKKDNGTMLDIQTMCSYIQKAAEAEEIDLDSEMIADFCLASDTYDSLTEDEQAAVNSGIREALETVRNRIAAQISSVNGVTVTGNPWYVQLHVQESSDGQQTMQQLSETYPGTLPQLLYDIEISYTDIRTGEAYQPMTMISLAFPVPEGYESLTKPRILRSAEDSFMELTPQMQEDGTFYLDSARTLTHLIVADFPAGLQGISLNSSSIKINRGQKHTLKVVPIPESVTENYNVTWKSSNTSIAKVSKKGVVTAVKNGKATITATVAEHPEMTATCKVTVMQGANTLKKSVSQVMAETSAYMRATDTNPSVGSEWYVLGLARGGLSLKEKYFSTYYNHTANYIEEKKGILTNTSKYTEYSKRVLVLTAEGKDARNVGGYNLFKYISDLSLVKEQGLNGPIWALLAVNCHPEYSFPDNPSAKEQNSEAALVNFLLQSELSGGGWALMGSNADSDVTGMTLQALAPYYHKAGYENVTAAIDRGLARLSEMQNDSGGYSTMGVETEESCAQVITALCSLGIDPETDSRFIKGGHWTIENLITYHIAGSGFMHVKAGAGNNGGAAAGTLDGMATEQGYYALVAYQRLKDGKTGLYDMSDVSISKGGKGDGTGTGLKEPTPIPTPTSAPAADPSGSSGNINTKKPGGSGKSLGGKSSGKGSSGNAGDSGKSASGNSSDKNSKSSSKNSKSKNSKSKNGKNSVGWDFEAESYVESEETSLADDHADGSIESAEDTGSGVLTSDKKEYGMIFGFAAAGALAGGLAGSGIKAGVKALIRKRRKKK